MPAKAKKNSQPGKKANSPTALNKRSKRVRKQKDIVSSGGSGIMRGPTLQNAPLARAFMLNQRGWKMSNSAQRGTDAGDCDSLRVEGTDISGVSVMASSGLQTNLTTPGTTTVAASVWFGPNGISSRLARQTGNYSWYAFRELEFTLVPLVGPADQATATTQSGAAVGAFAITQEVLAETTDYPSTFTSIMEINPSVAYTAWEGGKVLYKYNGTRLWCTSNGNGSSIVPADQVYQVALSGRWYNAPSIGGNIYRTHIVHVRYVVDLYRSQEPNLYPSLVEIQSMSPERRTRLRQMIDEVESEDDRKIAPPPLTRHLIQSEETGSDGFYRVASPTRREPSRPQRRASPTPSVKK